MVRPSRRYCRRARSRSARATMVGAVVLMLLTVMARPCHVMAGVKNRYPFHLVNQSPTKCPIAGLDWHGQSHVRAEETASMSAGLQARRSWPAQTASAGLAALASILLLAGCSGSLPDLASPSGAPSQPVTHIGEGAVKAALIVPL